MLLGRQLVALEERQNYSLGLRKKKNRQNLPLSLTAFPYRYQHLWESALFRNIFLETDMCLRVRVRVGNGEECL